MNELKWIYFFLSLKMLNRISKALRGDCLVEWAFRPGRPR